MPNPPKSLPPTAPLLPWLLIQLGVVLLAALRVPLAAGYPDPAERLAPHLLFGAQVVGAGMLFPFLMRNWQTAAQVIATAVPFQLVSSYLAGVGVREIAPAMAVALAWFIVLAIWRPILKCSRARMLGVCVATSLTGGGGVLRYLRLEFAGGEPSRPSFETASPLLTTLAGIDGKPPFEGGLLLGTLVLGGLVVLLFRSPFHQEKSRRHGEST